MATNNYITAERVDSPACLQITNRMHIIRHYTYTTRPQSIWPNINQSAVTSVNNRVAWYI